MEPKITPLAHIDWSECRIVERNPQIKAGRPVLRGTRMPVDDIVDNYQAGVDELEIAQLFEIPVQQVRDVLAYAAEHDVSPRPV